MRSRVSVTAAKTADVDADGPLEAYYEALETLDAGDFDVIEATVYPESGGEITVNEDGIVVDVYNVDGIEEGEKL